MILKELQDLQDVLLCAKRQAYSFLSSQTTVPSVARALVPVHDDVEKAIRGLDTAVGAALRNERNQ
jgi:hypothetical protein